MQNRKGDFLKEIVKYNNDLNDKIVFPDFKEQELNIFANLLCEFREREAETLIFSADEVSKFFGSAYSSDTLGFIMREMAERLRVFGFKWTRTEFNKKRNAETVKTAYITMFPTFYVECEKIPENTSIEAEKYSPLKSVEVRINPDFQYLLSEINNNFTRFELIEFMSLSGKYTKTLYRLLKQYSQTGWLQMEWQDFKEQLNIPTAYEVCNIDQSILKPAIKSLSKYFKNLKYTKIKKGGNKVTAIRFDWDIKELESEKLNSESEKAISGACVREPNLQAYCGINLNIETKGGFVEGRITNVYKIDRKITMEITSENLEITNFNFENLSELEKCVNAYKV